MKKLAFLADNLLYNLDFFKTPFMFAFNSGREKMSSLIGSIFSLIIIAILMYFFFRAKCFPKKTPMSQLKI